MKEMHGEDPFKGVSTITNGIHINETWTNDQASCHIWSFTILSPTTGKFSGCFRMRLRRQKNPFLQINLKKTKRLKLVSNKAWLVLFLEDKNNRLFWLITKQYLWWKLIMENYDDA